MVSRSRPSRADYYHALAAALPARALVVTALGNASYLWAAVHDAPENFYFEDAMGLALPMALGLSVAQPDREVVVVEGDGGLLMHMGGLVTVGAVAPGNLTILLIDNGVHGASGGQALTSASIEYADLAGAVGLEKAARVETEDALRAALADAFAAPGPTFLALATAPDTETVVPPLAFDPAFVKNRFMEAIGAPRYVSTIFGGGMVGKP
ncbi:MAG: thiamine pyrophosphate-dependent enzyme [Rhodospirillales bacterium]|jgi:thiamine pyrophosphate-dependent acetolactate synthase large subunit-like protein